MAKFIAIAQVKGGTGKSTLATNLAGFLARGHQVGLIDADMPQGTASTWALLRQDPGITCLTCDSAAQLTRLADQLDESCDIVIIDLPPRSLKFLREIIPFTDLVLIPAVPAAPDLWATERLVAEIRLARKTVRRLKYRLVWNRLRAGRAGQDDLDAVPAELRERELTSWLHQRQAYVEAIGAGGLVDETRDRIASGEFRRLVAAVIEQL